MTIGVLAHGADGRGSGASTTLVVTLSATPTDGNALLALAGCHLDVTTKHVIPPGGWTTQWHVDGDGWCVKAFSKVAASEGNTVTITFADSGGAQAEDVTDMVVVEVNGTLDVASLATLDAASHGNPHSIPSITPPGSVEALMLGLTLNADPYGITTAPTLYTALDQFAAGGDARVCSWYQHAASTTGSYADTYNMGGGAIDKNIQAAFTALTGSSRSFGVLIG